MASTLICMKRGRPAARGAAGKARTARAATRRAALVQRAALAGAMACAAATAMAAGPGPAPGQSTGRLCVSTAGAAPGCGPAELEMWPHATAWVRVSDIVYQLTLHPASSRLDVVLMHGAMQIDGFITRYQWSGHTLRFSDPDKDVRYEVHWQQPAPAAKP